MTRGYKTITPPFTLALGASATSSGDFGNDKRSVSWSGNARKRSENNAHTIGASLQMSGGAIDVGTRYALTLCVLSYAPGVIPKASSRSGTISSLHLPLAGKIIVVSLVVVFRILAFYLCMRLCFEHHHPHAPLDTSPHKREVYHNVSASFRQSSVPPDGALFRHI